MRPPSTAVQLMEVHGAAGHGRIELHRHADQPEAERAFPHRARHRQSVGSRARCCQLAGAWLAVLADGAPALSACRALIFLARCAYVATNRRCVSQLRYATFFSIRQLPAALSFRNTLAIRAPRTTQPSKPTRPRYVTIRRHAARHDPTTRARHDPTTRARHDPRGRGTSRPDDTRHVTTRRHAARHDPRRHARRSGRDGLACDT